jgi:hypothetical protein
MKTIIDRTLITSQPNFKISRLIYSIENKKIKKEENKRPEVGSSNIGETLYHRAHDSFNMMLFL